MIVTEKDKASELYKTLEFKHPSLVGTKSLDRIYILEKDELATKQSCSIDNPECEACQ